MTTQHTMVNTVACPIRIQRLLYGALCYGTLQLFRCHFLFRRGAGR